MARFNTATKSSRVVKNYEGAKAYKLSSEMELYSLAATSLLVDKFYESASKQMSRLESLVNDCEPEFVAKLAVYAREQMYLRSLPVLLVVLLAKRSSEAGAKGFGSLVAKTTERVIQRADEISEVLACYQQVNGRSETKKLNKLSSGLKRGLAAAFNKFDEYQFSKYNRDNDVKLRDALFLVHPIAKTKKQQKVFDKIVTDTLETAYTWETEISAAGQGDFADADEKAEAFTEKWKELIDSDKLGYMALLRNLRNILLANVGREYIRKVAKRIGDQKEVARAKQFPFRFLAAYRELKEMQGGKHDFEIQVVLDALEVAIAASAVNIKGFDEDTDVVIACDVSGSMQTTISPKSKVQNFDIGLVLGMLLQSRCHNVIAGMFGDTWKILNLPKDSVLRNADEFHNREGEVGYSTNGYAVVEDLLAKGLVAHKVMMFTDCQMWDSYGQESQMQKSWAKYKKIAPDAKLYLFDLAGHGNTPVDSSNKDVFLIAGWSDRVFDMLDSIEGGGDVLAEIRKIVL